MKKIVLLFFLSLTSSLAFAQEYGGAVPELQVSYFGEFIFHPGAKVGISLPFSEWTKLRQQQSKRRGEYSIVKQKELRLGGNVGFYNIVRNHTGYFANVDLTWRRSKYYSYRPEKKGQIELGIGLGYFRYRLHGTTFTPNGDSFDEINGNGGAFLPSFLFGYGGTFRYQGERNARYFLRSSFSAEIPFGYAFQFITALEAGIAIPLKIKGFEVQKGKVKVKERKRK